MLKPEGHCLLSSLCPFVVWGGHSVTQGGGVSFSERLLFSFSQENLKSVRINVENEHGQRVVDAETAL